MRTRTTTTAVAGVLLAAAVLTATAIPAAAAPVAATASRPLSVGADGKVALDDANPIAGYLADISASTLTTKRVTATFTVPAVRCTTRTTNVLFAQLFLQGTDASGATDVGVAYVLVTCQGTTPGYQLHAYAAGADPNGATAATAPGDTVRLDLAANSGAAMTTIADVTTGAAASQSGSGFAATLVQASVQGGDAHSVFPRFNRVHFTRVVAVGQPLQALNPAQFQATDAAGNVKISTSPFDANGKGFTTTFVANFGPAA